MHSSVYQTEERVSESLATPVQESKWDRCFAETKCIKKQDKGSEHWLVALQTCKHEDLSLNLQHTGNKHMSVPSACNIPVAEMEARHQSWNRLLLPRWETPSRGHREGSNRGRYPMSFSNLMFTHKHVHAHIHAPYTPKEKSQNKQTHKKRFRTMAAMCLRIKLQRTVL